MWVEFIYTKSTQICKSQLVPRSAGIPVRLASLSVMQRAKCHSNSSLAVYFFTFGPPLFLGAYLPPWRSSTVAPCVHFDPVYQPPFLSFTFFFLSSNVTQIYSAPSSFLSEEYLLYTPQRGVNPSCRTPSSLLTQNTPHMHKRAHIHFDFTNVAFLSY